MIKPITTIVLAAFAISAFAQGQTIKIKSRGDDVQTVIDTMFEQTGKQYVLESNFHQRLYMNLDGVSFEKAVEIISNITDMEFKEKQGIWYIHKKPITAHQSFTTKTPKATPTKPEPKTKAPAKSTITKPKTSKPKESPKPKAPVAISAGQSFAPEQKLDLTGRLTVQLKKMEIRDVFSEFGRQTKVEFEFDDTVPNYKLDATFYNTTVKFALDKVCKVANLKYTITPSKTVRISKI